MTHHFVKRHVLGKRFQYPVTVTMRSFDRAFFAGSRVSNRVGIASDVQPVPPHPFTHARIRHHPIHASLKRIRTTIFAERLQFIIRRRKSGQIKVQAAKQRVAVRDLTD